MFTEIEAHLFKEIAHTFWCYSLGLNPEFYRARLIDSLIYVPRDSADTIRRLFLWHESPMRTEEERAYLRKLLDSVAHFDRNPLDRK